jgi:hypothetical protein
MFLISLLFHLQAALTPASVSPPYIDPQTARSAGWRIDVGRKTPYTASWFATRYQVAPPTLEVQTFATEDEPVDVYYLRTESARDREKLWTGLAHDLAPNQALAQKDNVLVWIVCSNRTKLDRVLQWIQPSAAGTPSESLDWVLHELPHESPELAFSYSAILPDLTLFEGRVSGLPLRMVYQVSYATKGLRFRHSLAQVDFWVPCDEGKLGQLVEILDQKRTDEQTVFSGKGLVAVVTARSPEGNRILVDELTKLGYRRESRPRTPVPLSPTPVQHRTPAEPGAPSPTTTPPY